MHPNVQVTSAVEDVALNNFAQIELGQVVIGAVEFFTMRHGSPWNVPRNGRPDRAHSTMAPW